MELTCPECSEIFEGEPFQAGMLGEWYVECSECGAEFVYSKVEEEELDSWYDEEEGEEFGLGEKWKFKSMSKIYKEVN